MANASTHRLGAAVTLAMVVAHEEEKNSTQSIRPIIAGYVGAAFGTLPDILEPAHNPNHRQFFHSLIFAGLVGVACRKIYSWQPATVEEKTMRFLLLLTGGAYLTHLAMDAFSSKGLPVLGKL